MRHSYTPHKTCSTQINFEVDDGLVRNVSFTNGCAGNLAAISVLVEGMPVQDLVGQLKGLQCGNRGTSCADQLAIAVEKAVAETTK